MIKVNRVLITLVSLITLVWAVSATDYHTVVSGAVITKGLTGILIPLGFDAYVSAKDAMYLYNLISVSVIMFIAAMSGPRSEAAFCIVVPIFAGIFMWFGWLRLATASATQGLWVLIILMGLFGIILYMNDQNRQNYGTAGPGSKLWNVAFYLMFFSAALTLVSGFTIFPIGATQPIPGTCAVGYACDAYGNIDFVSSVGTVGTVGSLSVGGVLSSAAAIPGATIAMFMLIINIIIGIVAFPVVLNSTMNGIFPGISSNAMYLVFLAVLEVVILAIYAQGLFEMLWKPAPGTTL